MPDYSLVLHFLEKLIASNTYRLEGYENASKKVKDLALKGLFELIAKNSRQLVSELLMKVSKMGASNVSMVIPPNILQSWKEINSFLINSDNKDILIACEQEENVILSIYHHTLESADLLPEDFLLLIHHQTEDIIEGRDSLRNLREHVYAY